MKFGGKIFTIHQGRLTVEPLTDETTNRRAKKDHLSTLRRHFCAKIEVNLKGKLIQNEKFYFKKHETDLAVILN